MFPYIKAGLVVLFLGLYAGCAPGAQPDARGLVAAETKDASVSGEPDSGQVGIQAGWDSGGIGCSYTARNVETRVTPIPNCTPNVGYGFGCQHLSYADVKAYYPEDIGPNGCGPNGCGHGYKDEFTDTTKFNVTDFSSAYAGPATGGPYGRKYRIEVTAPFIHEITFPHGIPFPPGYEPEERDRVVVLTPLYVDQMANDGTYMYMMWAAKESGWVLKKFTPTHITVAKAWNCGTDAQGYQVEVHVMRSYGNKLL